MDKKLTIGDKVYDLRLRLGVFDNIKEISGQDGIGFISSAGENIVFSTYVLVMAAAMCYHDKHGGSAPDKDALMKQIKTEADTTTFKDVMALYVEFMNAGEAPAQPMESQPVGPRTKN